MFKENDFHTIIEKDDVNDKHRVWTKIAEKQTVVNASAKSTRNKEKTAAFSRLRLFNGISAACSMVFTVIFAILSAVTEKFDDIPDGNQTIANTDVSAYTVLTVVFGVIFVVSAVVAIISLILEKRKRKKNETL